MPLRRCQTGMLIRQFCILAIMVGKAGFDARRAPSGLTGGGWDEACFAQRSSYRCRSSDYDAGAHTNWRAFNIKGLGDGPGIDCGASIADIATRRGGSLIRAMVIVRRKPIRRYCAAPSVDMHRSCAGAMHRLWMKKPCAYRNIGAAIERRKKPGEEQMRPEDRDALRLRSAQRRCRHGAASTHSP